jgi:SIR2-like domain
MGCRWENVDEAAKRLGFADPDLLRMRGTDLQILEYFRLKNYGFADLTHWLYAEMRPPDDALRDSPIHAALATLELCKLYYTTNYDDFLERAFELHGRVAHKVAVEAHMGHWAGAPGECEILKFHGDLSFPSEMVLSDSDYEKRLKLMSPMDHRLKADMLGRTLLFIGYSFRDWNVAYLFRLINETQETLPGAPLGPRAYIIVPEPSDFERRLFLERNIEVIPVGLNLTADVAVILDGLA